MDSFLKHGGKPPKTPGEDEVTFTGSHPPETQTAGALAGITSVICEGDGKTSEATDKALGGTALAVPEKPLSKAQRRRLRKAERDKKWKSLLALGNTQPETTAVKRSSAVSSTPSPADIQSAKKPRTEDHPVPGTYSQVTSGIKMAVIKNSFLEGKLTTPLTNEILGAIDNEIDNTPIGEEGPQFISSSEVGGALVIHCANDFAVGWLKSFFAAGKWGVKVLPASELPKPVKIALKTKDTVTMDSDRLLRRLELLNPGLSTKEWRVRDRSVIGNKAYTRWIFEIDLESSETIQQRNLELFAGSHGKGLVKILQDPNKRKVTASEDLLVETADSPPGAAAKTGAESMKVTLEQAEAIPMEEASTSSEMHPGSIYNITMAKPVLGYNLGNTY